MLDLNCQRPLHCHERLCESQHSNQMLAHGSCRPHDAHGVERHSTALGAWAVDMQTSVESCL